MASTWTNGALAYCNPRFRDADSSLRGLSAPESWRTYPAAQGVEHTRAHLFGTAGPGNTRSATTATRATQSPARLFAGRGVVVVGDLVHVGRIQIWDDAGSSP